MNNQNQNLNDQHQDLHTKNHVFNIKSQSLRRLVRLNMGTDDKKLHNTGTFRKKQVIKNFISVDFWGNMLRQVNCQVNCSIASSCNE